MGPLVTTGVHGMWWCVRGIALSALVFGACTFDPSGLPGNSGGEGGGPDAGPGATGTDAARQTPDARRPGPDARPASTPDAIPPANTWVNLLRNSGFESAGMYWVESNSSGYQIIADDETYGPARTGAWAAWFGGIDDEHANLGQEIYVPDGATGLRVRGWIYISAEINGDSDKLELRLEPSGVSSNASVDSLVSFLGSDAGATNVSGWIAFEANASDIQAGESLRFVVKSDTNGYDSTLFVVDDLVLEALAPAGS